MHDAGDASLAALAALRGLPWVLRERRVVPPHVEKALRVRDAFDARVQSDVTNASALIQSSTKRPIAKRASA